MVGWLWCWCCEERGGGASWPPIADELLEARRNPAVARDGWLMFSWTNGVLYMEYGLKIKLLIFVLVVYKVGEGIGRRYYA